jgi:hypothetical protein
MRRRLAALFALVVGVATLALAIAVAISEFPRGLVLLGGVLIAGVSVGTPCFGGGSPVSLG